MENLLLAFNFLLEDINIINMKYLYILTTFLFAISFACQENSTNITLIILYTNVDRSMSSIFLRFRNTNFYLFGIIFLNYFNLFLLILYKRYLEFLMLILLFYRCHYYKNAIYFVCHFFQS